MMFCFINRKSRSKSAPVYAKVSLKNRNLYGISFGYFAPFLSYNRNAANEFQKKRRNIDDNYFCKNYLKFLRTIKTTKTQNAFTLFLEHK